MDEPVSSVMTRKVISCRENDTVSEIMESMTVGKFRHLPVVEDGKVVGLISIGDLTPEQRRKFDEDGYFIVEDVFSPSEVEEMRSEFERLRAIEGDMGGHEVHIEPGAPRNLLAPKL